MLKTKLHLLEAKSTVTEGMSCLRRAGDAVIIERGRPRHLLLCCPCGCGQKYPVNLDRRIGPAWRLRDDKKRGISVFPSIWRQTGCRSHFVISHGSIILFEPRDELDETAAGFGEYYGLLRIEILSHVPFDEYVGVEALLDHIDADPWDLADACLALARERRLLEGKGANKGRYKRRV